MEHLADAVLNYFWFLNFSEEEEADVHLTADLLADLVYRIKTDFTEDEKHALMRAAERRLAEWLREPDEYGYTPRKLLTPDKKQFLEEIAAGKFSGDEDEEDEGE